MFSTRDGEEDDLRCSCVHTFIFGPNRQAIIDVMSRAEVPGGAMYTLMSVLTYAGQAQDLRAEMGVLRFDSRRTFTCTNPFLCVSNFLDEFWVHVAVEITWRRNIPWQRQVSTMRHRITEALRAAILISATDSVGTMVIARFVNRPDSDDRDIEVDSARFWGDPHFWQLPPASSHLDQ